MSMNTAIATKGHDEVSAATLESVLIGGDLAKLTAAQRIEYYRAVCHSVGLNPLTKPFEYLNLSGKLVLYARKDATDQLRTIRGISIDEATPVVHGDLLTVTVKGHDRDGRTDVDVGAVFIGGLKGDSLANATKKAFTQGKRRLTLSLAGLGWLDETETTQIAGAHSVAVDLESGEIIEERKPVPARPLAQPKARPAYEPLGDYAQDEPPLPQPLAQPKAEPVALYADPPARNAPTETQPGDPSMERLAYLVDMIRLEAGDRLNEWEQGFFRDMAARWDQYGDKTKCSPKQFASLEKILAHLTDEEDADGIPF
jgi:hypothetical protein